jgi:hypothetical protein
MPRVITNAVTLSRAREASLGVLPGSPVWYELEPNNPSNFGTTTTKMTRSPISRNRARRKGRVSDLDSGVEYEADLTLFHLRLSVEEFCFARAVGGDVLIPTAVTNGTYTVPAVTAAQAGRLKYGVGAAKTLFYARGFDVEVNNGLKELAAVVATAATEIMITDALAETIGASQFVELAVAGIRGAPGDLMLGPTGILTSGVLDFTTLGWSKGQVIHLGGVDALFQFGNITNNGFVRLRSIAAHACQLEKKDGAFIADDGTDTGWEGEAISIDILFGQFVRNVDVGHADYVEWSTQFEIASPNLMSGGATGYEYAIGNWPNQLTISVPLTDKATMGATYVGTNTTAPSASRASGAANAKPGVESEAFGSSSDIARLRIQDVDEQGLTTDFKAVTITLKNNVAGEKVLAYLGPKYLNAGNLEVDIETTLLFSNPEVPAAIRGNDTQGFEIALRNDDGGVLIDLPTGTLDGGAREYPANQSVTIKTTFAAHQEQTFDFTLGVSFFPVLPDESD